MTYHCGSGNSLARAFGREPCDPHITCDGCGVTHTIYRGRSFYEAAKWFLDGKHAPGWTGGRNEGSTRTDYCPQCKEKVGGGG